MGTTNHYKTWDHKPRLVGENCGNNSCREDNEPDEGFGFGVSCLNKVCSTILETGSVKDRGRSGRPSLRQKRSSSVGDETETLASESAAGISRAREAGGRLGLKPSSIRNVLHVLNHSFHKNYSLAMHFYRRIPYREKHF
ncbi:hypothetical protein TNCV_2320291 [Trichonephila clavipes]|nr:hypothetical protein TNCV_2320291 [Trichonephila clavipes]